MVVMDCKNVLESTRVAAFTHVYTNLIECLDGQIILHYGTHRYTLPEEVQSAKSATF